MTRRRPAAAAALALLVVVTAGPFAAALAGAAEGDPTAGADVYRAQCAMCHGADAAGMMGMHPALRGAVERLSVEGVKVTIRNGRGTTPPMPAFANRLSDGEITDVIAYIGALPDGPRNFGPGHQGGTSDSMMDGMMDGGPGWMVALLIILAAALAGVVGYLIGARRAQRPRP